MSVVHQPPDLAPTPDVASPDTVAGVQEMVRAAAAMRNPLRIIGCGTWLDAGHPTSPDARPLRVSALQGVTQYTPGDLTLTARAGTTLAAIAEVASSRGQWLPLDPFSTVDHSGTIGATIATASSGPLSYALGLPRDTILGVEVVTGDGAIVRGGGQVVKNVAGFDLTRLMTGAWGTLGVITEVTVRLRGRPLCDETVVVARRRLRSTRGQAITGSAAVEELTATLRASAIVPLAAELLNAQLATALGIRGTDGPVALVRLGGNAERVAAERRALDGIAEVAPAPPHVWTTLRRIEPEHAAVLRWAHLPRQLAATWAHAASACSAFPDALMHASISRGVVRAIIPHPDSSALAEGIAEDTARSSFVIAGAGAPGPPVPATYVAERLPASLWGAAGSLGMSDSLSRRVRRAFDPARVLNVGILGEGLERD
jgi:glycolate oxidase FAD binding subunit